MSSVVFRRPLALRLTDYPFAQSMRGGRGVYLGMTVRGSFFLSGEKPLPV
jgi:hypothetical protein